MGSDGQPVFLKDLWPTLQEVRDQMAAALRPEVFRKLYTDFAAQNPKWNEIPSTAGNVYAFDAQSHVHPGAAVFHRLRHEARRHCRNQGRPRARPFR